MKFLIKRYNMRKTILSSLVMLTFMVSLALKENKIPSTRIKMLNGEYAKLSDFNQDGPMIINFWTTW